MTCNPETEGQFGQAESTLMFVNVFLEKSIVSKKSFVDVCLAVPKNLIEKPIWCFGKCYIVNFWYGKGIFNFCRTKLPHIAENFAEALAFRKIWASWGKLRRLPENAWIVNKKWINLEGDHVWKKRRVAFDSRLFRCRSYRAACNELFWGIFFGFCPSFAISCSLEIFHVFLLFAVFIWFFPDFSLFISCFLMKGYYYSSSVAF